MTVRSRSSGTAAANTSFSVTISGQQTGDRILVGFVNDNATNTASTSSTGWSSLGTEDQGTTTNHRLTIFSKDSATGSDTLTVTTSETQEGSWGIVVLEGNGGTPTLVFNDGGSAATGTVGAITGLASDDYDSVIFLALDNSVLLAHTVTAPSGWGNVTTGFTSTDVIGAWSMDQSAAGVTGFSPANVTWTNAEQWITAHVVVAQADAGPIEKTGTDTALGTELGDVAATADSGETALGTESGSIQLDSGETAIAEESGFVAEEKLGGETAVGTEVYDSSATSDSGETAVGTETYDSTATVTPPVDVALGTEEGHIAIPGEDVALATDAHVPPTLVTVTTGEEALGQEGGYVETLFGDLIVNLYAVDPDDGTLTALPDYVSLDFSRERNSKGAVSLTHPVDGKSFDLLRGAITSDRDLEFELWTGGTPAGAMRGYLQEAAGDDVAEESVWTFAGSFLEKRADETVVFPQDRGTLITDPDTGEQTYSNAKRELIVNADNPGELMLLLLDQAQDRGALTDIVADFTTTHDSNGVAWAGVLSAKFSPGSTYTQILDRLVALHLAEWAIVWDSALQQKTFKLWNAEGRGADLTLGPRPVTLRRGRNLLDAPRKWSVRESATTVLAAGAEGLYDDETDATALARRDRRVEAYVSLNNITDDEALLAFAQAELATLTPGLQSVEHGIGMLPGEPRPIVAFDIGDWVFSQSGVEPERLRVVQWTLRIDADRSLSGTVTLNTTVRDALETLRERLDAISSGEAVVGTSEPGPQVEDRTPPAAPEGVVASSIAYQDPQHGPGVTLAMVTVGWLAVTTNADGSDSPLVQAAVFIKDKIEDEIANPPDPEDPDYAPFDPATWTWKECPQIVRDFAAPLRALWVTDGSPDTIVWLTDFIAEMTAVPTAAQDVAGYNVRYSYLGLEQVGGIPSSDPFPEDERVYYEATPPSGTAATSFAFGGIEGGSRLRIEVRAFDRTGNYGAWTSISHDSSDDATPPPIPSAPTGLKTWFRTLDVPWDGLGAEGEVMPSDFSHVRIWVGQGSDLTLPPEEEIGDAVPFDPLETEAQYVAQLFAAGTWNIPDLPIGVGYYARLQAVDYVGNASDPGAIVGPVTAEQLVSQDLIDDIITANLLGPNSVESAHIVNGAITTAKIVDAAIVSAKIGTAQINSAHIQEIEAGKISTGTLQATVTVTGSLWTSTNPNATRLGFSAAGLQLYKTNSPGAGSTLVGEWRTSDGSMLVTGTYRSSLSGQRIHIDPDGTMYFYPTSGTNRSSITNEGNDIVWRGPLNASQKSGRLNVNTLGVGLNFSTEGNLLGSISSEFVLFDRRMRMTAPLIALEVDESFSSPSGNRRIQFAHLNSSGNLITRSSFSYGVDGSDWGGFYGNDTGWKLAAIGPNGSGDDGRFVVTNGSLGNYGVGLSAGWEVSSSGDTKKDVGDVRAILNPQETLKAVRAKKFRYAWESADTPPRVGVVAEELPGVLQRKLIDPDEGETTVIDLGSQIGVLWGALNQIFDQEIVSTSGIAILLRSQIGPGGIFPAGATAEVTATWESAPPVAPTGGFVQIHSSFVWAGKIAAWIKTGSVTATGCTVVFKNISNSNVVVNENSDALRVSATAIGLGLYTPPYIPPEEP